MNGCPDLFLLSVIACKLSECLSENELSIVAASLTALGDMLEVIAAHRDTDTNSKTADTRK